MYRVAYFSNKFATAKGHGIARYAHHLFSAMQALPDSPSVLPVAAWSDRSNAQLKELQSRTGLKLMPWGRRMTPLLWTFLGWPFIEKKLEEDEMSYKKAISKICF